MVMGAGKSISQIMKFFTGDKPGQGAMARMFFYVFYKGFAAAVVMSAKLIFSGTDQVR